MPDLDVHTEGVMSTAEMNEQIQFTVDHNGKVTAVVAPPDLWQLIVAALEDAEDRSLVQALRTSLANGPVVSGALRWQDVADQWQ
jgi:hypothetical protein